MYKETNWEYREFNERWELCEFEVKSDGTWGQMILGAPIACIERTGMMYCLFNPQTNQKLGQFPTLAQAQNRGFLYHADMILPTNEVIELDRCH